MKHCSDCSRKMTREEYEVFRGQCADCKAEDILKALEE